MTLLAFALAYVGMLALCLAMPRHHRQLFSRAPSPLLQRGLRLLAGGLLIAIVMLDVAALGVSIGLIVCLGQLMCAGLLVGLMLAWRERMALPMGAALSVIGALNVLV
ncbi:MAG: DUF3325 domain-containing protein [Gammaproteobacteria bacterium]|uniref:DUF3325 domain-containing protein n=1 Tax=Stutzerimonas xanthomarina TaxID=271420 RepID=UPI00190BFC6D|nr:DUF3325 domain-containing protein [Stutzerimonas xanthomarina]MBU0811047.1 DUF3325 domain-containing protein [Gammaproteobacteria bacterium]MBK3845673.1 DUF3325 family protein [Stutzerimonas xanthomarina]MBK3845890.1 DUF3325 family protein [Stutzerimonas xanthomarina]MBK3846499.1 DUF3325 family protein [Stutzerimonas xanthomarina]MBU0852166.1 DUF3325 domain-containing protein [Gammaproteobacteria bacterium]|tara:strand:- start:335 stop:658 length:324 start_codon:yes stop_codon:yes gene_type:complete